MLKIILIICVGAAGGAVLGSTRSCETGCCPLTATPLRGAIYGACLAAFAAFAFVGVGKPSGVKAGPPSKHLIHIESAEQFDRDVLGASEPVLVDFYADWCGPCQRLAPIMNELADEWVGKVKVAKVNVDDQAALAKQYGVSSIPDVRLFVQGKEVDSAMGLQSKSSYVSMVEKARAAAPAESPTESPTETPAAPEK